MTELTNRTTTSSAAAAAAASDSSTTITNKNTTNNKINPYRQHPYLKKKRLTNTMNNSSKIILIVLCGISFVGIVFTIYEIYFIKQHSYNKEKEGRQLLRSSSSSSAAAVITKEQQQKHQQHLKEIEEEENFHKILQQHQEEQEEEQEEYDEITDTKTNSKYHPLDDYLNSKNTIIQPIDETIYPHTAALPQWMRNYINWHHTMRTKYSMKDLFHNTNNNNDDPNIPKVLIRTCMGLCGGLHDRIGQLPWDIYLANQTQRLLFIVWVRPKPLEEFLIPSELLNWSVPPNVFRNKRDGNNPKKADKIIRAIPQLFHINCTSSVIMESNPEPQFWKSELDACLQDSFSDDSPRILRHRLLGHLDEPLLEDRLLQLGETDVIHWTSTFGHLFRAFFRLSDPIEKELKSVYSQLNIQPDSYSAVHCRVRHPKATPPKIYVKGKNENYPADKTGLPWEGYTKDFAIATATKAVQCARLSMNNDTNNNKNKNEPLYFFSDSNDLVRYMSQELTDPIYYENNIRAFQNNTYEQQAYDEIQSFTTSHTIISRNVTMENAHIDRQKGREASAYYGTFLDFMLALNARCVTYGVGYFALFATKLNVGILDTSGKVKYKNCPPMVYQEETWGGRDGTKMGRQSHTTIQCPIHNSNYDLLFADVGDKKK